MITNGCTAAAAFTIVVGKLGSVHNPVNVNAEISLALLDDASVPPTGLLRPRPWEYEEHRRWVRFLPEDAAAVEAVWSQWRDSQNPQDVRTGTSTGRMNRRPELLDMLPTDICEDRVALQFATGESLNDSPAAATSAATAAAAVGGE